MRQSHAAQHVRRLGELKVVVADNLYAVAPWVEKVALGTITPGSYLRDEGSTLYEVKETFAARLDVGAV
jgi:hypothetical protein